MIVGICGRAGSGKSTAARHLVEAFGFVELALADPLKRFCHEVFGFSDEQLWGPSEKRNEPDPRYGTLTPRRALQTLGTEWARACYPDVWVDYGLRLAKELESGCFGYARDFGRFGDFGRSDTVPRRSVVISDVRFPNEGRKILEAGGKVIKLVRPAAPDSGSHASEAQVDEVPWTVTIESVRDVAHLHWCLDQTIGQWQREGV